jgi:hypothetical protein
VATGQSSAEILVLAPNAAGQPDNLYTVPPLRSIPTDESVWHPWPGILTTDTSGNVIAAITRLQGNAIEVFASSTPSRVIAGPQTGLGATPDQVVVTYSPYTGQLYVGVSAGAATHISVFAGDANGDARPVRTIAGPSTNLPGGVITGIAVSQVDGAIYAMVKIAQFAAPGYVMVYDRFASGDAAPVRAFTDADTWFADAQGIAIGRVGVSPLRSSRRRSIPRRQAR